MLKNLIKKLINVINVTNQGIESPNRNKVNPAPKFNGSIEFNEYTQ